MRIRRAWRLIIADPLTEKDTAAGQRWRLMASHRWAAAGGALGSTDSKGVLSIDQAAGAATDAAERRAPPVDARSLASGVSSPTPALRTPLQSSTQGSGRGSSLVSKK